MQCQRQPAFLKGKPTQITEIWEVRLPEKLWRILQRHAVTRKKTLSTITRFCALPLADRGGLRWFSWMLELQKLDREEYAASPHHRHMVCLYGEDALLLRLAALRLRISVSAFIRLALRMYLQRLAMENHSKKAVSNELLYWLGIKRWYKIPLTVLTAPLSQRFLFLSFPPEYRW